MEQKIICYGDSNTWGYDGADVFGGRLPAESRWTDQLAAMTGLAVVNLGLNGRQVPRYPRSMELDRGLILRHGPCRELIVMLGSNDIMCGRTPEETAESMGRFLALVREALPDCGVLLLAPPAVRGFGAEYEEAFQELAERYEALAEACGAAFADTERWRIETGGDGLHFSPRGHRIFAVKLAQMLRVLL